MCAFKFCLHFHFFSKGILILLCSSVYPQHTSKSMSHTWKTHNECFLLDWLCAVQQFCFSGRNVSYRLPSQGPRTTCYKEISWELGHNFFLLHWNGVGEGVGEMQVSLQKTPLPTWGKMINALIDIQVLIPETCAVTFFKKRVFADVIQLKDFEINPD